MFQGSKLHFERQSVAKRSASAGAADIVAVCHECYPIDHRLQSCASCSSPPHSASAASARLRWLKRRSTETGPRFNVDFNPVLMLLSADAGRLARRQRLERRST